uniref:Uncharacterized protein n=1 Tax=Arundo donax TaxID=35708 RepID=A0A0A9SV73_ARUDO
MTNKSTERTDNRIFIH